MPPQKATWPSTTHSLRCSRRQLPSQSMPSHPSGAYTRHSTPACANRSRQAGGSGALPNPSTTTITLTRAPRRPLQRVGHVHALPREIEDIGFQPHFVLGVVDRLHQRGKQFAAALQQLQAMAAAGERGSVRHEASAS